MSFLSVLGACSSRHLFACNHPAGQRYQLLVTLDAAELTKNQVINFLDEVFGCDAHNRSRWVDSALFCMSKADKLLKDKNYQQEAALRDFLENYHEHGIWPCLVYNDPSPSLEDGLQRSVEYDDGNFSTKFDEMSRHIASLDSSETRLWEDYSGTFHATCEDVVDQKTFRYLKNEMYQSYRSDVECLSQVVACCSVPSKSRSALLVVHAVYIPTITVAVGAQPNTGR